MAHPGCAAGRTPPAAAPPARRRAGARRAAHARSGWSPACGYIYLWRDPHGSRWMSIRLLALIPVAAAISLALSAAVDAVALPLFLDTTGTILATALAGPGVGIDRRRDVRRQHAPQPHLLAVRRGADHRGA